MTVSLQTTFDIETFNARGNIKECIVLSQIIQ